MEDLFETVQTPGDIRKEIGELVKLMRNSRKLTQKDLAERLNLTRLTIQKVERGKNFNIDTLLLIFQHFELLKPFSEFLVGQRAEFTDFGSIY